MAAPAAATSTGNSSANVIIVPAASSPTRRTPCRSTAAVAFARLGPCVRIRRTFCLASPRHIVLRPRVRDRQVLMRKSGRQSLLEHVRAANDGLQEGADIGFDRLPRRSGIRLSPLLRCPDSRAFGPGRARDITDLVAEQAPIDR